MEKLKSSERFQDSRSGERRPRKAAYALPTLFTAGNVFLGFLAILKAFEGCRLPWGPNPHFEAAALAIGVAFALDGLDGRIARMTNTVSDFGREMDSLADVITFGIAPSVLAFTWGFQFIDPWPDAQTRHHLIWAAYFVSFMFLLCGAMRLARFNVQADPVPQNPGHPDRKYFVGLPIPAAASMIAAVVYAFGGAPLRWWPLAVAWLFLLGLLAFLMISTWRYRSFKDLNLLRPRSPVSIVLIGAVIYLIYTNSQPVLLAMATVYVFSGVVVRIGGALKRRLRRADPSAGHPHVGAANA
jgi:CDP-diacylglycerol--serine O-phosphatidyltransferase